MIKYLVILINSITVFIFGLMGGNGIKITSSFPTNLEPGKEVAVEIKITKGELTGYGRFQLDLPEGLTVRNSEEKDLEFSIEENKARWVWTSLPAEEEITIKLVLVADQSATGEKLLSGKFSYVENNEKQQSDMEEVKINIGSLPSPSNPVAEIKTDSSALSAVQPASNAEPPGLLEVTRTAERSGKDFIISIKIKKGNTKGFARYSDDAHENVQARPIKTDGSSFSISDGKIKFVWVNVPERENLEVSYSLSGEPGHPIVLNGEYSYLEDSQSKKVLLAGDTLNFNADTKKGQVAGETKPEPKEEIKKEDVAGKNDPDEKPVVTTPAKTEGQVDYRVQVGAFTNPAVTSNTMKRKFRIAEKINTEMQNGFTKFMVGSHKVYKIASEHRETIKTKNNVASAFVVAYNFGKRITVQEALMVSSQKWNK